MAEPTRITIGEIHFHLDSHGGRPHCDPVLYPFTLNHVTVYLPRGTWKMELALPDDKEAPFGLPTTGKTRRGNEVPLNTPATCRVSDTAVLELVQPDPTTPEDPASGVLRAVGPLGTAQFIVEDVDESTVPLTIIVEVAVVAGDIVELNTANLFKPLRDRAEEPPAPEEPVEPVPAPPG